MADDGRMWMLAVAVYGAGRVGTAVAERLRADPRVSVTGPLHRDRAALTAARPDVTVIATTTRLADVADDIRAAIAAGSDVIVSAEEAAYPWAADDGIAEQLDTLAQQHGVTVLGAGLNPGFLFDALVLTLTGVHTLPHRIQVSRVVDVSAFGPVVRDRLGLGIPVAEFERRTSAGELVGHVGFRQSISLVAAALGVTIDRFESSVRPITGADGMTAGVVQDCTAIVRDVPWFVASFTGHLDAVNAGLELADTIEIRSDAGRTSTRLDGGVPSLPGSIAVIANSVHRVRSARPGWLTVADLPPAHPQKETT